MKTLIVFASKHGTTEHVAELLAEKLQNHTDLVNLKKTKSIDMTPYDRVIIGGSIHAGMLQKKVKKFCENHTVELLKKKLGLFICCMHPKNAESQFEMNYPEILRKHSSSNRIMGGEFKIDSMNFIEKAIVKKVSGVTETQNNIDYEAIDKMVEEMQ